MGGIVIDNIIIIIVFWVFNGENALQTKIAQKMVLAFFLLVAPLFKFNCGIKIILELITIHMCWVGLVSLYPEDKEIKL